MRQLLYCRLRVMGANTRWEYAGVRPTSTLLRELTKHNIDHTEIFVTATEGVLGARRKNRLTIYQLIGKGNAKVKCPNHKLGDVNVKTEKDVLELNIFGPFVCMGKRECHINFAKGFVQCNVQKGSNDETSPWKLQRFCLHIDLKGLGWDAP